MRRAPAKPVRACILWKWCPVSHVTCEAPLRTSHFSLHSSHSTYTLHTPHFTLHTPHFTLHTPHFTVHTSHFKNTTKNSCCCVQEHDLRAIPAQRCQLSSKHFPHTSHCILQISRSTLLTCTSFQLISSEIFSSHFMSSHMSAKFFLAIFMSSERSSNFLISPKLVSTHLVPVCGKKKRQTDRSRNRRTHEVPFIVACSHFTRKNTRFRAPASSPKHSPCNIMQPLQCGSQHQLANLHLSTHRTTLEQQMTRVMQPFQCDLQPEIPKHPITTHTQAHPKQLQATVTLRQKKKRQTDRSRNRRTHEVPFIVACSHFTRKNTRFRAPASSPKHSPCKIMQPLQCGSQHQLDDGWMDAGAKLRRAWPLGV